MISYDEFKKVDLRVGRVVACEPVEGSEKLLKLLVDVGEKDEGGNIKVRQILAGIAKKYTKEDLIEKNIVVVANLEPRQLMGLESQGMLLAAGGDEGPVILRPNRDVAPGVEIR